MKRSILTIEDCKALRYLITTVLDNKYTVTTVPTSFDAMQFLTSNYEADLIILDIPSDASDNYELLEHISTSSVLKDIPVVVLSGKNDEMLKNKVVQMGASGFFPKPFDPVHLTEQIDLILAKDKTPEVKKRRVKFNLNIF